MTTSEDRTAEMYRDGSGDWRWRIKARNGKITADSAEGYRHRTEALEELNRLVGDIDVEYVDGES